MFRKPFQVKSNTNMRNSDRRKLLARLHCAQAIPSKSQTAHVRLVTNNGLHVCVYTFDKCPLLFEVESDPNLYPTVYFCWQLPPELSYPTLMVNEQVFSFLQNGADLMLPGVVYRRVEFPEFARHSPVAISVMSRDGASLKGPLAIGIALMSSMEMIANKMQGRGVQILHIFRDYLWEFGDRSQPPQQPTPTIARPQLLSEEDFPALGNLKLTADEKKSKAEGAVAGNIEESTATNAHEDDNATSDQTQSAEDMQQNESESMENLLRRCFLAALKYRVGTKTELPLDVGEFYSRYLLPCVPSTSRIDMKRTRFKKFSVFLNEMNSNDADGPIVKITSKSRGIDVIGEINWSHRLLTEFETSDEVVQDPVAELKPRIRIDEYLAITEPVLPLFRLEGGLSKGDLLQTSQVREAVTNYVKRKNLVEKNKVSLQDDLLKQIVTHNDDQIDWNTLIQKVTTKMTKTFVITTLDGRENIRKKRLPQIEFKIETRSGNKKITMVNNLSVYGVECKPFCHRVQVGIATSATVVNEAPQCEGPQVIIQGNQIHFASELLCNEYGIDKKYMSGLQLQPKKKR